ncbi:branched-chain amino acid ABC transporter permease [Salinarimonas ramus]|uniref:Branched-chain amino acid ABC transporter permease n=1 Tax=Salinarimonas ramus TaxID=690164 RepID=A0A917Q6E2_9HYPH|nr:branched-chain amino acid ABC transporter permease [Salinarimonas ramus]GGK28936.1 branched-chain amino acid ABC transporter permease [Salinarimonas ramus]
MLDTASPAAAKVAAPPPEAGATSARAPLIRREALAFALFAFFAIAPAIAQVGAEGYLLSLVIRAMIFAIAALSLDLILGYGALVSFGHAAFVGIGCYAVGILMAHSVSDLFVQLLATLLASALFALVTGAISLRTKGVYFIMITLAFGQMIYFLTTSLAAYGGDDGLTLPSRSAVFGTDVLENDLVFYYLVLACLVGVYALLRAIVGSRFGRVLRGTRENPVRMQAIGYDPYRYQLVAYVIAGMIAGLSGFLLANHIEFVSPAFISWQRSGELIIMVVLGGMGTLVGPIVGAMSFLFLEEILARITQDWKLIFGPLLVLVALFARGGILGFFRRKA